MDKYISKKNEYIYCVKNESMPDIYKIGVSNLDYKELLDDLFKDNIPTPFKIVLFKKINNADNVLNGIYAIFKKYRTYYDKDYFKLPIDKIKKLFDTIESEDEIRFEELDNKPIKYLKNNTNDLEFYIRYKLGQRNFPKDKYNGCSHLKLDHDAREDEYQNNENDEIIGLFKKFYVKNKIIIRSHKGSIGALIVDINDKNNYATISDIDSDENYIDLIGIGTVEILKHLLSIV